MTFIPVRRGDLRGGGVLPKAALSQLKGVKSALSCVNFNQQLHQVAFEFLLGQTVVVNDLTAARKLAFSSKSGSGANQGGGEVLNFFLNF